MRPGIAGVAALAAFLAVGSAEAAGEGDPRGRWTGSYVCSQGVTSLQLFVEGASPEGWLDAYFHFFEHPSNPGVPEGCYSMDGRFDPVTGRLELTRHAWITRPPNYVMVDLSGTVEPDGSAYKGVILVPDYPGLCTVFSVERAEPAMFPQACLDQIALDGSGLDSGTGTP